MNAFDLWALSHNGENVTALGVMALSFTSAVEVLLSEDGQVEKRGANVRVQPTPIMSAERSRTS